MSIEEQMASEQDKVQRAKRIPVASADGSSSARMNDRQVGKRRRIRITTSDGTVPTQRQLPNRHDRDFSAPRNEWRERRADGLDEERSYQNRRYHKEYEDRYEAQRAEGVRGNDYRNDLGTEPRQYTERPRPARTQPAPKKAKATPVKKAKAPTFIPQEAPSEVLRYPEYISPDTEIRLNKYLASAGVCSRREADLHIAAGDVRVNGEVVTELGRRVKPQDIVEYKGEAVSNQSKVYVLLNKPKNCVTTSDDPECRLTVMDLVKNACPERIYPVGRLDRNTTGVLLITNDGDLAAKLTHPSFLKKKIYHVWLNKPVEMEHMQAIADGFDLEDGEIHADAISYVTEDDLSQVGIEIHSGRNRIVRRIFEHFGYHVMKLDRVYFAGLTKKNLPRGRWRFLSEQEVTNLRMGAFE